MRAEIVKEKQRGDWRQNKNYEYLVFCSSVFNIIINISRIYEIHMVCSLLTCIMTRGQLTQPLELYKYPAAIASSLWTAHACALVLKYMV